MLYYIKRRLVLLRDAKLYFEKADNLHKLQKELKLNRRDEIQASDIVIVGYPKSGNTWFQNIVAATVYGMNLQETPLDIVDLLVPDINRIYYHRYTEQAMYFKSHLLPQKNYRKVIYLVRDGRDALVSYYHYRRGLGENITWQQLLDNGVDLYGKWQDHIEKWQENPYQAEMITMRYEDLLDNTIQELKRFCEFAGIERDESALQLAKERSSFKSMRSREDKFGFQQYQSEQNFVRRGKKGSFQDEMPPEVIAAFQEQAGECLQSLGYEL